MTATAHPAHSGGSYLTTAVGVAKRTLLQFFRTPQVLMMGTIQGALFLFMFRYVFGGAIRVAEGLKYVDFMVPGFLVTTILWIGMSAAAGVAEDANGGLYDRLRSLPVPRSAVMLGRSLADAALVTWGLLITAGIGFAVGFRPPGSITGIVAGFLLIIVGGWALSWVFILMGLISSSAQAAQGLSMLVIPFSFVSSANVPVSSMPGWMQPFAANQPITVLCNAARALMLGGGPQRFGVGHSTTYWVVLSLVWCAGITAVILPLCAARFGRRR